jgi:acyl-CoA synthetase (AMP-forming)/AMP-acid ligase II
MLLYNWLQEVVKSKGGSKALIYRDTYLSWRGLKHRVDRRAAEFSSTGIRPGDWVGLMLGNVPDFVILSLALSKLDAAPLPLDPTTSTRELEMIMAGAPIRGLITRPRGGDAPLPSAPRGGKGRRKHSPESRRRIQGTLLSASIYPLEPQKLPAEDQRIAAVMVTADSAGDPKVVERTRPNLQAEALHVTRALDLTGEDRALLTVPLFHSYGFDVGFLASLRAGAAIYLEDEVAASRIIKLVREQQITLLPGSTTLFEEMAKLPAARPLTHKPMRFISAGGGLHNPVIETFRKKYGVRPMPCYHTSETGTVSIDVQGNAADTAGRVLEGVEVRITSPKTGKKVAAGRKGLFWVRSDAVSPLGLGPQTEDDESKTPVGGRDPDGWYRTGDLATLDRSGRLRLQGREDDIVRLEGKRVALGEVESCIESFPLVRAAQARLITDPLGGPMVVARVVLKDSKKVDPEEIIDHCARNLSPYKVPRRIEIKKSL